MGSCSRFSRIIEPLIEMGVNMRFGICLTFVFAIIMTTANAQECGRDYRIRSGDTLSALARRVLGDMSAAKLLYERNVEVIGPDPNRLEIGKRIYLCLLYTSPSPRDPE